MVKFVNGYQPIKFVEKFVNGYYPIKFVEKFVNGLLGFVNKKYFCIFFEILHFPYVFLMLDSNLTIIPNFYTFLILLFFCPLGHNSTNFHSFSALFFLFYSLSIKVYDPLNVMINGFSLLFLYPFQYILSFFPFFCPLFSFFLKFCWVKLLGRAKLFAAQKIWVHKFPILPTFAHIYGHITL